MSDGDSMKSDEEDPLQKKILAPTGNTTNYGACTVPEAGGEAQKNLTDQTTRMGAGWGGLRKTVKTEGPTEKPADIEEGQPRDEQENGQQQGSDERKEGKKEDKKDKKDAGSNRTKSNQRWMKLRTTVQLSGAITSTIQKSKPPLKREDSFMKRFSTRQIPEPQETIDTGEDSDDDAASETNTGPQDQDDVNRRRSRRRRRSSKFVVNPDEDFHFYWLMLVALCVLYNLWALIVRQSFPELQEMIATTWFWIDVFTDIIFAADVVVQFRTGYLEQGLMVYDWKKLSNHYMQSTDFVLDVLAVIPLDLLQFFIGVNPIIRFPRFMKTYRLISFYYIVESRTIYPNIWRVVNLVHILLIIAHWFGCFYFLLSEAEGFQGDWVYPYAPGPYSTLSRKYLGSLYWSTLTLTTIGDLPTPETDIERRRAEFNKSSIYPNTTAISTAIHGEPPTQRRRGRKSRILHCHSDIRYMFTIASYLIGVFIFATIVGQVGNIITNRNASRLEFERLLDGAKMYMRHHKVPSGMKRRVLRWYDYSWSRGRIHGGGDINTALGLLPDKLKTELALHVNLSVLKKVTIFQECQPEFLHDLVLKMRAYIFTPGDLICRKGEIAREMFIIADGILDVISENGRVLTTMGAGDFFGEIGVLNLDGLNKRTADVRSVGYSELFSLARDDVLNAMHDYPEAKDLLLALGRKRLMEAQLANKARKGNDKDQDSSVDSDAGRRIVEKLRSDVKSLKEALKRTRRCKDKFMLQRMSNVHSSDEYDVEATPSPIGAGLPLLQRLRLLKEKQDREKIVEPTTCHPKKDQQPEASTEVIGEGLPLMQRLRLLKQKEQKEEKERQERGVEVKNDVVVDSSSEDVATDETLSPNASVVTATVHTQLGVQFEQDCEPENKSKDPSSSDDDTQGKKTEGGLFRDALKKLHAKSATDDHYSKQPQSLHEKEDSSSKSDDSAVAENKSGSSKGKIVKGKESWSLLKKSSLRPSRAKKAAYLSKSDTILERRSEEEEITEKRSRSASPVLVKSARKSLKGAVENIIRERRRTKSLTQAPKSSDVDVNAWEFPATAISKSEPEGGTIKKYDSVDDLSPQYSGLSFVKKLEILNEMQKITDYDETIVRSISLDVPERTPINEELGLIRSQSEASAFQSKEPTADVWTQDILSGDHSQRSETVFESHSDSFGESPIHSPESNETLERRHLKSILKRLSAEDHEDAPLKKVNNEEMRKLLQEQTVEGYAARHAKLTKSVTFNRDTLQSPPKSPQAPETMPAQHDQLIHQPIEKTLPFTFRAAGDQTDTKPFQQDKKSQDEELFRGVILGIKQVMQGYLDDMESRYHIKCQKLENDIRRRDEFIARLQEKLKKAQGSGDNVNDLLEEDEENLYDDECDEDSAEKELGGGRPNLSALFAGSLPTTRGESLENVVEGRCPPRSYYRSESPPRVVDNLHELFEPARSFFGYQGSRYPRRYSDPEHIELLNIDNPKDLPPLDIRRAKSLDEAHRREYITLEMDDSDCEGDPHNPNWEVEMLAEELENRGLGPKSAQQSLEDIAVELKTLQKVFGTTDLSLLSAKEVKVLEGIIDASDKKITSISQLSAFEDPEPIRPRRTRKTPKPFERACSVDYSTGYKRHQHSIYDSQKRCKETGRILSRWSLPTFSSSSSVNSPEGIPMSTDSNESVFQEQLRLIKLPDDDEPELPDPETFLRRVSELIAEEAAAVIEEEVTDEGPGAVGVEQSSEYVVDTEESEPAVTIEDCYDDNDYYDAN